MRNFDRRHTGRPRKGHNLLTVEGDGGRGGAKSYDVENACSPTNHSILSASTSPGTLRNVTFLRLIILGDHKVHILRVIGWGGPNSDDWRKILILNLLCVGDHSNLSRSGSETPAKIMSNLIVLCIIFDEKRYCISTRLVGTVPISLF